MARRARVGVTLIEHGDEITIHFDDGGIAPMWFSRKDRPVAYAKLRRVLDASESVEDVPVIGSTRFHGPDWRGWREMRSA